MSGGAARIALAGFGVCLAVACASTGRPSGAAPLARVSPAAGSEIALAVGARLRIDPPDRERDWALEGATGLLRIERSGRNADVFWVVTSLAPGASELAFVAVPQMPPCPDPPNCPPFPNLPPLPFRIIGR